MTDLAVCGVLNDSLAGIRIHAYDVGWTGLYAGAAANAAADIVDRHDWASFKLRPSYRYRVQEMCRKHGVPV